MDAKNKFLTIGKFEVAVEGIKDLIRSTARGTETTLRKEIQEVKYELKGDVCNLEKRIDETRQELKDVEGRLSDKIDSIHTRLDDHEAKPIAIAHSH